MLKMNPPFVTFDVAMQADGGHTTHKSHFPTHTHSRTHTTTQPRNHATTPLQNMATVFGPSLFPGLSMPVAVSTLRYLILYSAHLCPVVG